MILKKLFLSLLIQGGGLFGSSAGTAGGLGIDQGTLAALKQQQMIQQQLKAIANTPFGDSPLFRNLPVSCFYSITFLWFQILKSISI